jgi:subtilisin family serine protease
MNGVHRLVLSGVVLAGSVSLAAGCSERSELDRLLSRGDPLAVNAPGPAASVSRSSVVTLITGDRVTLSHASGGEPVVAVEPGPGRDKVRFAAQAIRNGDGEEMTVVPSDALPLLASGQLDPQLFNVTELIRQGFDDGRETTLPLIVTYRGGSPRSLAMSGTRSRRWLASIQGEALIKDKADAGAFWRAISAPGTLSGGIAKIWLDARATPLLDESAVVIGAPEAWAAGLTGLGVTVAVLDTGIRAGHPDLAGRVVEAVDFSDTRPDADDNVGHGTHVAGTIAGSGAASNGKYRGIAPDASLIVGKVCGTSSCSSSAIIAGMEWAAPRARIVSMSLGSSAASDGTDPLSTSVNSLTAQHGALFVVAAGNAGRYQTVAAPAVADAALAVASIDKTGGLSLFSSRGPRVVDYALKPEIAAPGRAIVAARAQGTPNGDSDPVGDDYARLSGTSMATPHVSGSAALLAQLHPDWKADRLKAALMSTAQPVPAAVHAGGVGRVDLGRAIVQQVHATAGNLNFGLIPWPHEAAPISRTVTYQNDGDAAVTLELALSATDADGHPAPEGLLVADSKVTVPAHGSATAQVTLTPQARRKGLFGVRLTASDGTNKIESAGVVYQEPENYNLTIVSLDRDGQPIGGAFGFVLNLATAQSSSVGQSGGSTTLRLEKGEYDLHTLLYGAEATIAASRPVITLDQDTTVTLDGRLAKPLLVTVDRPSAALWWSSITLHSKAYTGVGASLITLSASTLYALPTEPVTGHVFNLDFRAFLGPATPPAGVEATDDYIYNLVFPLEGGVPDELTFRVEDRDLANVHSRYHKAGEATTYRTNLGRTPDNAAVFLPILPQQLPGRRLEYYTPGIGWQHALQFYPLSNPGFIYSEQIVGNRVYQVGHHWVRWNSAPLGPSFGPDQPLWGAYRINNDLSVYLTPFSPAEAGHATYWWRGTSTLSRDGVVIGTSPYAAYGRFPVPAEPGTYTLDVSGTREVSWSTLGTAFTGSWTFHSAPGPDGRRQHLPLMLVHATAPVDEQNQAPAGLPYLLSLEVQRQPGSPQPPVTELKLEVSHDDGGTWQQAEVFSSDERVYALVLHPAAPGFVSLRCSARDADGNTVTHTLIRAYRTQLPGLMSPG